MWELRQYLTYLRVKLINFVKPIPLIGALVACRLKDHAQAAAEFLCTIVLGTMPLWLDALSGAIYDVSGTKPFVNICKEVVINGELYLYCASFLAPIFYIALTDKHGDKPFPSKLSFLISTTIILMISAYLFSIKRSKSIYDADLFSMLSIFLFIFSAFLLYLATVYRNFKTYDFSEEMYKQEEDFTDEVVASRGQR
ncbi:MAG: hypothetical protein WC156_06405 [Pedobacter sp.]